MNVKIISAEEYEKICDSYQYFYNSMAFHELNRGKVERLEYLLFSEKKNKLALAVGLQGDVMKVPYSAPFGVFEKLQKHIKLEDIDSALQILSSYARKKGIARIIFRMPPIFYDESFLSKLQNCLLRNAWKIDVCDLNYQFFIRNMDAYMDSLQRNARKNLKNAARQEFVFRHCDTDADKEAAYQVIAINRFRKGYPLRMAYEQVYHTIQLTEHDFFLLTEKEINVAAAVVFRVNRDIYQVIYWGDIDGYESKRPMNYLAYKLYEFYVQKDIRVLDIGPSTEDGIPNYGLCGFKESIGCEVSSKITYVKNIK
ncbi:MAG: hypothetical protein NC300_09550 [Bacteroidales bacterium]|nr:hypothetical protein [Clostridium sp.]MCM1204376.1 hypothetical protein [Bacteroidales bacterium]